MMTQREMPLPAEMLPPVLVSDDDMAKIHTAVEALRHCILHNRSGFSQAKIAEKLNIDPSHLVRMLKTPKTSNAANFPPNKRQKLMEVCGNLAPLQFEARAMGYGALFELMAQVKRVA